MLQWILPGHGKREKETAGRRQFVMKLYKQENDRREEKNGKWESDVTNIKQTKPNLNNTGDLQSTE